MFRGYLLSSATATRSPIPALASQLIVNVAWTALHIQYSIIGLIMRLVIGLYLSWLMQHPAACACPSSATPSTNSTPCLSSCDSRQLLTPPSRTSDSVSAGPIARGLQKGAGACRR